MIFITQLLYVNEGHEKELDKFEAVAIPTIGKYNGRLLLRRRPNESSFIESPIEKPYEIHLIEFDSEIDFENFKLDEERKKFLHLKELAVKDSVLIVGAKA